MEKDTIKEGDVVVLKSGGPKMTVTRSAVSNSGNHYVDVMYWDSKQEEFVRRNSQRAELFQKIPDTQS